MAGGLEVVIPRGYDRRLIPDILHRKQAWIKKARQQVQERRAWLESQPLLPAQISLPATGKVWQVEYRSTSTSRLTVTEKNGQTLILSGDIENIELCQAALRRWLARQAREQLAPWLERIGQAERLAFKKVIIRGQKTRWGSCSSRGTISLNYKLLFLPPALVRYVLIHELCHTRHLNHSKKFWALVKKKEPAYKQAEADLRTAWRYVPRWVQDRAGFE